MSQTDIKSGKPTKQFNSRRMILIAVFAVVLAGIVVAGIIIANSADKIIYDRATDTYTRQSDGRVFAPVANLEPVKRVTKRAAVMVNGKYKTNMYPISGLSTYDWLVSEDGDVYHAGADTDISAASADAIYVCTEKNAVSALTVIGVYSDVFNILVDMTSGTSITQPDQSVSCVYYLRIKLIDAYEGLYYKIRYIEYTEPVPGYGKYFLYDPMSQKCMPTDGTIHKYLEKLQKNDSKSDTTADPAGS